MSNKKERVLFTREEIRKRVEELGREITRDYEGKDILVLGLLKGAFVFQSDLIREIDLNVEIDFMTTASYGHGEISSGRVEIIHDMTQEIEGKDVIIVDDIIDSGHTLKKVKDIVLSRKPKSVKICTMLDKPDRRVVDIDADYVGFKIPDVFIVGYGLNYGDYYRNIPYIFTYED